MPKHSEAKHSEAKHSAVKPGSATPGSAKLDSTKHVVAPLPTKETPFVSSPPVPFLGVRVGRLPPRDEIRAARLAREHFRQQSGAGMERWSDDLDPGDLGLRQRKIIGAALEGRDVVATLPGGSARLPVFLVPARILAQPTLVLGARPLLLRELEDRLRQRHVPVVRIDASLGETELARALGRIAQGGSLVVLAAPCCLLREELPHALQASGVALAVVDGAEHTASSSDQLSPGAAELGPALARIGMPPVLALLGPATPEARREVVDVLGLRSPQIVEGHAVADNVALDVIEARGEARQRALVRLALELRRPGIVLAPTAREVDAIYGALAALRLPVHRFHPHLPAGERVGEQLNFLLPGRRAILVATSALASPSGIVGAGEAALLERAPTDFGLGVEKRDVRFVIHSAPPASLEQYARELGLAGRDGEEAAAVLLYDPGERGRHESLFAQSRPSARQLVGLARALEPSTIDGRPRSLEALGLASGLPRHVTENMAALLDDAGLGVLGTGSMRALVSARALMAGAERLANRLDRLRARDARRLDAVSSYATGRGCLRQRLGALLGEQVAPPCGRCGACRGSVLPAFDGESAARAATRHPPAQSFTITRSGDGSSHAWGATRARVPLAPPR